LFLAGENNAYKVKAPAFTLHLTFLATFKGVDEGELKISLKSKRVESKTSFMLKN